MKFKMPLLVIHAEFDKGGRGMLISPNHDHAAALVLEELQALHSEMKAFCLTYGPQREDMEEDDDAAILMLDIALLLPANLQGCLEAIRLPAISSMNTAGRRMPHLKTNGCICWKEPIRYCRGKKGRAG